MIFTGQESEDGGQGTERGDGSLSPGMIRMNPAGKDESLSGQMEGMAGGGKTGFGDLGFHSTFDIIEAVGRGLLPDKFMLNIHPKRWTDRPLPWIKELVGQNVKNVIKSAMLACWHTGIKKGQIG